MPPFVGSMQAVLIAGEQRCCHFLGDQPQSGESQWSFCSVCILPAPTAISELPFFRQKPVSMLRCNLWGTRGVTI